MASPAGPSISREALVSPPLLRSQTWPQTEEQEEQWLLGKQAEWLLEDEQEQDGQEELGELCVGKQQQHPTQETQTQGEEQRQEREHAHTEDERKPEPQQQQRQARPLPEAEKAQHWQQHPQPQEGQRNFRRQPQQLLTLDRVLHVGREADVSAEEAADMEPLTRNTVPASAAGTLDSNSAANSTSPAAATLHVAENACEATSLHASSALELHRTSTANIVSQPEHQVAVAGAREDAREADAAAGPSATGRGVSSSQGTEERADDTPNTSSAATASAEAPPHVPPANGSSRTGHTHSEQAAPGCRGSSTTSCARAGDPRTGNSGGSNTDPVGSRGLGSSYSGTEGSSSGANSGSGGEKSGRESEEGKGSGAGQWNDSQGGGSTSRSADSSGSMSNSSGDRRSGKGTDRSSNEEDGEGSSSGRSADDYVVHSMDENTITFTYKGFLFSSVTRRKRRVPREGVLAEKSDARDVTCGAASDERVRRSSTGVQEAPVVAADCSAEPLDVENRSAAAEPPSAGTAAKTATAAPTAIAVAEGGARFTPCDISRTTAEKTPASSSRPPAVAAALHADAAATLVGGLSVGGGAAAAGGVAGSRATAAPAAAGRAPAGVVAPGVDGDARVALPPPLWYVPPRGRHYCCYVSQKAAAAAAAAASANERYAAVKQEQQQEQQRHANKAQEPHSTAQAAEQGAAAALTAQEEIKLTSLTPACCPHVCADCATHAAAAFAAASAPCATAAPASAPAAPSAAFPVSGTPAAACVACAVGETPKGRYPLRSSAVFPGGKTEADAAAAGVPFLGEGLLAQGGAMKDRSAAAEDGSVQGESPVAGVSHRRPTSLAPAAASPQEKTPEAAAAAAVAAPLILDIPLVQAELPCLSSPGGSSSSSWTSSSYYSNQTSGSVAQSAATSSSSSSLDTTRKSDSSSGTPGVAGVTAVGGSGPAGERRSSGSSREGHEETGLRDMDGGSLLAQQPCFPCERSENSSSALSSDGTRPLGSVAAADAAAAQLLNAASQTSDSTAAAAAGGGGERGRGGGGGAGDPSRDEQKAAAAKEQQHVVAGVLQKTAESCSSVRPDPAAEAVQAVATRAVAAASAPPAAVATASVPAEEAAAAEEKNRWTMPAVEAFMLQLRRGELRGSHQAARRTAEVLRQVVDQHPWKTTQELVDVVKQLGRSFLRADPMEFLVSNVVRRILCIIRTEHCKQLRKRQPQEDDEEDEERCSDQLLQGLGSGGSTGAHGDMTRLPLLRLDRFRTSPLRSAGMHAFSFSSFASRSADDPQQLSLPVPATVKHSIFEGISELVAEVDTAWEEGEDVRTACFSNGDCILTYGYSLAVERLLKALHRKNQGEGATHSSRKKKKKGRVRCSFQVLVLGGDTEQGGKKMAERLVAAGIKTAYVADAALLTVIHKVDKVLLGTRAILSSGGAVALSGARYVAEAAKIYNRPVMVVAPLFKLTHLPLYDQHSRNQLLSPSASGGGHRRFVADILFLPTRHRAEGEEGQGGARNHVTLDKSFNYSSIFSSISRPLSPYTNDQPKCRKDFIHSEYLSIPKYDYIPDTLLAMFITEIGPVDPSCLFFLAQQRYDVEDLDLYAVV